MVGAVGIEPRVSFAKVLIHLGITGDPRDVALRGDALYLAIRALPTRWENESPSD
jgi:hypothetical protein